MQNILISGGTKGLGLEIAKKFSQTSRVIVTTRYSMATDLPNNIICKNLDVSRESSWQALFDQISNEYGAIDVLINNAGIDVVSSIENLSISDFQHIVSSNITGVFLGTKHAIINMKNNKMGLIINIASAAAHLHETFLSAYTMTKAAVVSFTRSTAKEMIGLNYPIRCVAISPGFIDTGLGLEAANKISACLKQYGREMSIDVIKKDFLSNTLTKRAASSHEIADMVTHIASGNCQYLNGTEILIDNGLSL